MFLYFLFFGFHRSTTAMIAIIIWWHARWTRLSSREHEIPVRMMIYPVFAEANDNEPKALHSVIQFLSSNVVFTFFKYIYTPIYFPIFSFTFHHFYFIFFSISHSFPRINNFRFFFKSTRSWVKIEWFINILITLLKREIIKIIYSLSHILSMNFLYLDNNNYFQKCILRWN